VWRAKYFDFNRASLTEQLSHVLSKMPFEYIIKKSTLNDGKYNSVEERQVKTHLHDQIVVRKFPT
jgi:hypothetical protein